MLVLKKGAVNNPAKPVSYLSVTSNNRHENKP